MKHTFKNLLIAVLVLCTFVGVLPMIAADDMTAQAAAADIYYDFKKANDGSNISATAATKRSAFAALTYDVVAARNTSITSGAWAYNSYSAVVASGASTNDSTAFTGYSYVYYNYDKNKGLFMSTGSRHGVLTAGIKFKGMNAGTYVPYLNINGAYLRAYSGLLTAKIYQSGSSTPIITKEICLSDYPDDNSYVRLANATSFSAAEYILELSINNERTLAIINGLQLKAADTVRFDSIYPTSDLGVYKVVAGQSQKVYFTQLMSDGTTSTEKFSGWSTPTFNDTTTTTNSYVTASISSSSQYVTITGVAATSTPQTVYINNINGLHTSMKINVIVLSAAETQSDVYYSFEKARPASWSANHVHYFGKHIKYNHTAVGGYGEINPSISSAPWKVVSIASTSDFAPLYDGYGIEHRKYGITDLKIQVPVGGIYMPQLHLHSAIGVQSNVTVSIINSSGTTVCSTTIPAGTTTEYVNLAQNGVSLSGTEYTVRFNKPSTGTSASAGANYYNGIKLVKTNNTTVTLDPNGGTAGSKTSVVATNGFPMPGVDGEGYLPTRTGYRFGGYFASRNGVLGTGTQYYTMAGKSNHDWDKTSSTATLYASWNVNTYHLVFNANGGSGTMSNQSINYDVQAAITANTFTRTGYTFAGWATSANGAVKYNNQQTVKNLSTTNQAKINLYAVWTPNTYSVKYNANGGSGTMSNSSHTYGTAKALTANAFTKTGYTFNGWNTKDDGSGTAYANSASVKNLATSGTVTLYAQWKLVNYTITYNLNSGTQGSGAVTSYNVTTATFNLPTPTRTGYTFGGWYTTSNFSGTAVTQIAKGSTGNKTFYAKWTANTYEVTLNANGGTGGTASVTATYGSAMPSATMPTRTGFTFAGYYDATSGGTKYYNADGTSARTWNKTAETTLYARWTRNTYAVTLDANGGTAGTTSVTASYGSAMPAIETLPTRTGYTFAGYYDAKSGGTQYYKEDGTSARTWNKAAAATLYARWTANTYEVTFDGNGGTVGSASVTATYGSAMPSMGNKPTRTGYTFAGYYDAKSGGTQYYKADGTSARTWNKAAATTLYARWTANTYEVTFDGNGGTVGSASVTATYGSAMPSMGNKPTRTGFTFAGYYDATSGGTKYYNADGTSARAWNKTEAATLYARWTANTYTITLDDGTSTTTITATYDAAMPAITAPKAAGKVFGGYYDEANGAGTQYYTAAGASARTWNKTGATTLYAYWTAATVTLTNPGNKSVTAEDQLTFSISGSTNSGMGVTYLATNLPSGATFSGDTFTWTPTIGQIGTYYVTFKAVDGDSSESRTITITVNAPKFTVSLSEGGTVEATYGVAMPEIDVPTKTGFVFAGYFDGENGTGTQYYNADGTSARNWNKTEAVTLYAKWIQGDITITQIEDKTVNVEQELTFTVEATSTAPDAITYTAENLPDGATFDTQTGEFSWTPSVTQVGEYNIIFKGSDGINYAQVTVKVVVTEIVTKVNLDDSETVTATYGAAMPTIAAPTRDGYIFAGYFDGENGEGTQYYKADGTSARNWDKKDAEVTLYAKWVVGDDRLGTRFAVLKDVLGTSNGKEGYFIYLFAGVDSLNYKEVGFEVTINGYTRRIGTKVVYQRLKYGKTTYKPTDFGSKCTYGYAQSLFFGKSFDKDTVLTFRAYAIGHDDNIIYGKEVVVDGIYTNLVSGEDPVIDGEVEYD